MNESLEPEDGLTRRLRALGQLPIDSATQARHLTEMAEAAAAPSLLGTFANRLRIGVALVVGFLLGTTGLASAGALGPLQPVASTTLEKVGIEVPRGGSGVDRVTEGCPEGTFRNRGQYLKAMREQHGADTPAFEEAKKSRCGMPVVSKGQPGVDGEGEEVEGSEADELDGDGEGNGKGKPQNPGNSAGKAKGADSAKTQKGAASDDADDPVPGEADAACAGGAGVNEQAPPAEPPAMPECAEEQKEANAPAAPAAGTGTVAEERSSEASDVSEDKTQDTPAAEKVPSEADTTSDD